MSHRKKPEGHVPVPLTIFAFVSLLLGAATEVLGTYRRASLALKDACIEGGMIFKAEMGLSDPAGILITAAAVFGLIAALLGTPGGGRRAVIGVSALFLMLTLIPAFAVWGIYWNAFGPVTALFWGWISATIYARSHRMPCEGGPETAAENVIDLEGERGADYYKLHSDGKS